MQGKVLWAVLMRRWYLLIAAFLLAAAGSFLVVNAVGPTYQATAAVLVLPPQTTVRQDVKSASDGNPYLALGGLNQVRDIVIRSMTAQTTLDVLCGSRADPDYEAMRTQLCKPRPGVTFEATPDYTNSAPIILLTVDADSKTNAIVAMNALMGRVPEILNELQSGLKLRPNALVTSATLVADRRPETIHKNQIRAGIVAAGGLLALSVIGIGFLDALLATRTAKKRKQPVAAAAPDWWDDGEPDHVTQLRPRGANADALAGGSAGHG